MACVKGRLEIHHPLKRTNQKCDSKLIDTQLNPAVQDQSRKEGAFTGQIFGCLRVDSGEAKDQASLCGIIGCSLKVLDGRVPSG